MNYYTGVISYDNEIIIVGKQMGTFWLGSLLSSKKCFKEENKNCFLFPFNILLCFIYFHALPLPYSLSSIIHIYVCICIHTVCLTKISGMVGIFELFTFSVMLVGGYCFISYHLRPNTYSFV